jgi:hypothetical protein
MPPAPPALPPAVCGLHARKERASVSRSDRRAERYGEDVLALLSPKSKQRTDATGHTTGTNVVNVHHVLDTVFAVAALFALGLELDNELLPEFFVLFLCEFGGFLF